MTTSIQTQQQPFVLGGNAARLAAALMAFVLLAGAAIGLANGVWSASAGAVTDTSYDVVEGNRAGINLGAGDTSYDAVEKIRISVPSGDGSDANPSRGKGLQPS